MTQARAPFATIEEADSPSEFTDRMKAGLFLWGFGAAILLAGWIWLGTAGMTDPRSPDFFPLPHFFAFASAALGTFMMVLGLLHRIRAAKFGTSVLEANLPEVGGTLEGHVRTARDIEATGPIVAVLRCDRRYESTRVAGGGNGGTQTECMWEARQELPPGTRSSLGLPFAFAIPATALRSGRRPKPKTGVHPEDPDWIEWTLAISAPTRGLNYAVAFPIQVTGSPAARASGSPDAVRAPAARATGRSRAVGGRGKDVPEETPLQRLGLGLLSAATLVIGGRVPDADERRAARRGEEEDAEGREPEVPFAGEVRPDQGGARLMRRVFLGFGLLFGLGGAWGLIQEVRYGLASERHSAVVTAVDMQTLDIALDSGEAGHVASLTRFHSWHTGQAVTVTCSLAPSTPRHCRMNTGADRFLGPLSALIAGMGFLALSWALRYRASSWRTPPG
jgi:hypothetical protein